MKLQFIQLYNWLVQLFYDISGITQEATDDDSFVPSDVVPSSEIVPPLPAKERSRSPSPPIEKEVPVEKEAEVDEEENVEPIMSPNRKEKADPTGDSGTGTGGTSIPSTPDSVFLERTLDRSDIESTSGYVYFKKNIDSKIIVTVSHLETERARREVAVAAKVTLSLM